MAGGKSCRDYEPMALPVHSCNASSLTQLLPAECHRRVQASARKEKVEGRNPPLFRARRAAGLFGMPPFPELWIAPLHGLSVLRLLST